jgi:hypothetical protein
MSDHDGRRKPKTFSELYPGRFLHADHLGTKQHTLTIADVDVEDLHSEKGKQAKAVLAFERTPLLLVLAKINGTCLKAMFGPNVQDWKGKRVTFYATDKLAPMNGEPCVRVFGSPDITRDIAVEYPMPRRKAIKMTLKPTSNGAKADAAPPQPKPEDRRRDEAEADSPPPDDVDELGGRM